jgi:hypothetical protein
MSRRASLRASDADREHIAERLRKAAAEGRILTEELEHRLGAAFSARTYGELEPLVADLPREVTRSGRQSRALPIPTPALVVGLLLVMPVVVAVVVSVMVLVASMFAMWALVALIAMWMFGRRPPRFRGRHYDARYWRANAHRWHCSAQRFSRPPHGWHL